MYAQRGGVATIGFDARGKETQPRRSAILYYQANQGRRSKKRNVLNACGAGPFILEPNRPNHLHCSLSLLDVRVARHCVIADGSFRKTLLFELIGGGELSERVDQRDRFTADAVAVQSFVWSLRDHDKLSDHRIIDMCIQFQSNFMLHCISANSLSSLWRGIST